MPEFTLPWSPAELHRVVNQPTGYDEDLAAAAEARLIGGAPHLSVALAEALARAPLAVRPRVVRVSQGSNGTLPSPVEISIP